MTVLLKTIARPYAKAAFDFAIEHKTLDKWSEFLDGMAQIVMDKRIMHVLHNPNISSEQVLALFFSVMPDLDENCKHLLYLLAEHRHLSVLPDIALLFKQLHAEYKDIMDVWVTSAFDLDKRQAERLKKVLAKRLNKKEINLHCTIDKMILGGAIISAGDLVIDGSGRSKLSRLKEYLKGNTLCN